VGLAALAATFWLSVATLRLIVRAPGPANDARPPVLYVDPPARPPGPKKLGEGRLCRIGRIEIDPLGRHEVVGNPLSKVAIVNGMTAVHPLIHACYEELAVPGTAMVNVVIGKSGRVTSAVVVGRFAGTPTGACVERAVKRARFPESDGFATPYPFQLR
jgi:hypothetical protein